MPGIVGAGSDFVQHNGAIGQGKHFHPKHTHGARQTPHGMARDFLGQFCLLRGDVGGAQRRVADVVAGSEFHHRVRQDGARSRAHDHHRQFFGKGAPLFRVATVPTARVSTQRVVGFDDPIRRRHHCVAFAVVRPVPRFKHEGVPVFLADVGQGRLVGHGAERSQSNSRRRKVLLLSQFVLNDTNAVGGGVHGQTFSNQFVQHVAIDVFDLHRQNVRDGGQFSNCCGVFERTLDGGGDLGVWVLPRDLSSGRRIAAGVQSHNADGTKVVRGVGHHATKLATAQDTDDGGFGGGCHCKV